MKMNPNPKRFKNDFKPFQKKTKMNKVFTCHLLLHSKFDLKAWLRYGRKIVKHRKLYLLLALQSVYHLKITTLKRLGKKLDPVTRPAPEEKFKQRHKLKIAARRRREIARCKKCSGKRNAKKLRRYPSAQRTLALFRSRISQFRNMRKLWTMASKMYALHHRMSTQASWMQSVWSSMFRPKENTIQPFRPVAPPAEEVNVWHFNQQDKDTFSPQFFGRFPR